MFPESGHSFPFALLELYDSPEPSVSMVLSWLERLETNGKIFFFEEIRLLAKALADLNHEDQADDEQESPWLRA